MVEEIDNWLKQTEDDYDSAEYNFKGKKYYVAAFLCQQSAEKALKSLALKEKGELIKTHNILRIGKLIKLPEDLLVKVSKLEPVYQGTRYPDVSSKLPSEEFDEKDAVNFLNIAKEVMLWVKEKMK